MTPLYLSRPSLWLPEAVLTNEDVLDRVRLRYRGEEDAWPLLEAGLQLIHQASGSRLRHKELDPTARIATAAVRAARACLAAHDLEPEDLDMLLYAGIGRQYLEPATAMEVAARLGLEEVRAWDISSACVSQVLGIANACAWFHMEPRLRRAMVCSAEISQERAIYDIQSYDEVPFQGAGITLGDAASAWIVSRDPLPGGCLRLVSIDTIALPQHWTASQTRLGDRFAAQSSELLRAGTAAAPTLTETLRRAGWALDTVEQVFLHQAGAAMHQRALEELALRPEQALDVHPRFGNTASCAVATAVHTYLEGRAPREGARFILAGAGAGLSVCAISGEWTAG